MMSVIAAKITALKRYHIDFPLVKSLGTQVARDTTPGSLEQ
jgi:hypothetical protein